MVEYLINTFNLSFNLALYGEGLVVSLLFFVVIWLFSMITQKSSIIDSAWGLHYFSIGLYYFLRAGLELTLAKKILLTAILFWSFRLALFLFYRFLKHGEDQRYVEIRKNWGANHLKFITMFLLQGFLAWLQSYTILVAVANAEVSTLFYLGVSIMVVFTVFESIADFQLFTFKNKSKNTVCNVGLWKYSRHPNYFSEWMIWVGLYITILAANISIFEKIFSLIGPIQIYILVNYVSGIPIMEKYARENVFRKIGEKEYFESTPAFFPKIFGA